MIELSRYIHLNPVRAKIVQTPEEYTWSSYHFFIGKPKPAKWLYLDFIPSYFGKKVSSAQRGYQEFINALVFEEYDSPLEQVVSSILLGSADFIASIYQHEFEGNRVAVRHWGIRRITNLPVCSTQKEKKIKS